MNITVTLSKHDDWQKHSFTRGRPDVSEIGATRRGHYFYVVLDEETRKRIADAKTPEEVNKIETSVLLTMTEMIEHVRWIED